MATKWEEILQRHIEMMTEYQKEMDMERDRNPVFSKYSSEKEAREYTNRWERGWITGRENERRRQNNYWKELQRNIDRQYVLTHSKLALRIKKMREKTKERDEFKAYYNKNFSRIL